MKFGLIRSSQRAERDDEAQVAPTVVHVPLEGSILRLADHKIIMNAWRVEANGVARVFLLGEYRWENCSCIDEIEVSLDRSVVLVKGSDVGFCFDFASFAEEAADLIVVDAGGSVEEVAEEIWKVLKPRIEGVENGEPGTEVRRVS